MWSQVWLVVLLSLCGRDTAEKREKRTIGVLFRGLVDAVTGPTAPLASLTYPSDGNDRRTTPRPDSRPQTQVFFVPLPERQRQPFGVEIKPPAPLKPADLAEIHIHPQLVKQLETLARAQSIRGKMIAKRYPLNATVSDDEYSAISEENTTVAPPPPEKTPMKYTVKILPEDDKGGLSVTIAVGKDGKVRIIPNKDKIKLDVNMTKKKNPGIKGVIKSLLKDVEILKSNSSDENDKPRPGYGDGPSSYPPYHGPVFTPEFPGGPVVPPVHPGSPIVPVHPPGGPALINNVPGPAYLYGDAYGFPPGPLGIPAGNAAVYPPHQEVYPPYNTAFNPNPNDHDSQPSKHTSRPYSQVEPFKDFLDFLGLSDSSSPQQPSHQSSPQYSPQNSPPRLPVHNLPLNNSPSHSYPPYNSLSHNFPLNNLPSHHFSSHGPSHNIPPNNLPPHNFPPHNSPSQNFPSHDSPSHNQIAPTKPLKFTDGNSGKGYGIHQDTRPFSHDHLDSNQRPFGSQSPSGYPQLPPLPGANGFINTIAQEFPSPYFPTHFPIQQPPPFTQGPNNFSPGSQFNFPQPSYGFPSNFPLRRSDNSTENCEKKSNQTC